MLIRKAKQTTLDRYFINENTNVLIGKKAKQITLDEFSKRGPDALHTELNNDKNIIINKFMNNVKGKDIKETNFPLFPNKHCGREGYWLETQMGIVHNSNNEPDILGYEMKKSSSKITLGDFSATEYLFSKVKKTIEMKNNNIQITRVEFIRIFGKLNPIKNRYSWSGKCVPTYDSWNDYGQMLKFNDNLDLCIFYSFEKDKRENKNEFPSLIRNFQDNIIIAIWKRNKLEKHINQKFNNKGFFICKKINNTYQKICFGRPFDFDYFVSSVKNKNIIFDSGMYEGNLRNYSHFRSLQSNFWNSLITEEY